MHRGNEILSLTWRGQSEEKHFDFNIFAQENYQVMNYGPGGVIAFHTDEMPSKLIFDENIGANFDEIDQMIWNLGTTRFTFFLVNLLYHISRWNEDSHNHDVFKVSRKRRYSGVVDRVSFNHGNIMQECP